MNRARNRPAAPARIAFLVHRSSGDHPYVTLNSNHQSDGNADSPVDFGIHPPTLSAAAASPACTTPAKISSAIPRAYISVSTMEIGIDAAALTATPRLSISNRTKVAANEKSRKPI